MSDAMKAVLKKYKDRLINLSTRNRSLVLKKIYKKRSFDLSRLKEFNEDLLDILLESLFQRNKKKVMLLDDPYECRRVELADVENRISYDKSRELSQVRETDQRIREEKKQAIQNKYKELKEAEIKKVENRIGRMIEYSASLSYLLREINAVEKETGLYELYIGYPFAEGRFIDMTFVKAPLLLFPVRITKDKNSWFLENIVDQEVMINKVFTLGFAKYNEVKIPDFETEFLTLEELGDTTVNGLLKYLKSNKIKIQDSGSRSVDKFTEQSEQDIEKYIQGELYLKNYLILGQFPISNSIYNDYDAFDKMQVNHPQLDTLLINPYNEVEPKESIDDEPDEHRMFLEQDIFVVSPLDYSQENAVRKSNHSNQLVVYGPPGTGKSQTITNMIANALFNGKKILMVSQKRAALDVIYNRLASLQSKIVLVHDANKDKKDFYKKVSDVTANLVTPIHATKEKAVEKAKKIDGLISSLERLSDVLHAPREFGLTLQKMYSKSKAIQSPSDERYPLFRHFKANARKLPKYNFEKITEAVAHLTSSQLLGAYIQLRSMADKNPVLLKLRPEFDMFQAMEGLDALDYQDIHLPGLLDDLEVYPHKDVLIDAYRDNNYALESKTIDQIGKAVCQSEHGFLLRPVSSCRWWSIRYWMGYNEIKLKEQQNRQEYKRLEELIIQRLCEFQTSINGQIAHLAPLKAVLNEEGFSMLLTAFFSKDAVLKSLKGIREAIDNYEVYRQLKYKADQMDSLQKKILDLIFRFTTEEQDVKHYLSHIVEFTILEQIYEIEKSEDIKPDLLSYTRFESITDEIKRLMEEKTNLTPDIIQDIWHRKSIQNAYQSGYKEFVRQANKKRMLWPIRKYLSTFQNYITDLFPCWLLSPETVSDIMPLREGMFDMIIFDEASQMFVENAIPAIFRAKQVVIAGDDQQLRPNVAFKAKYSDLDEEDMAIETSAALEEESLLDLAKVHYQSVHLNYHYRSQFHELINFSNYAFYGGRLQVSPNIVDTGSTHSPIERIKVNGRWRNRTNETEARKVVDLVAAIFKGRKKDETIGIITFNVNQKDMIEDFLEQRAMRDPDFKRHYIKEINRKVGDEDVSLFVKNIENVQGDERDIIIFSIAYAPDERERVSVNFGSLSVDGGENRLNVAVSRAKKKIYVITSIEPEELSVDGTKNLGPKLFKKYLQYAKAVSDKDKNEAKNILMSLSDTTLQPGKEYHFDSDFEGEVCDALIKKGYCVHTQVGVSGYKIDLAIYDTKMGRYTLGVECDGAAYHSTRSARERDIHRQRYLESRGWKIIRIWSRNWWLNPEAEIKRILDALSTQKVTKMVDVLEPKVDYKVADKAKQDIVESKKKSPVKQPIDLRDKIIGKQKETLASVGFGDTVVLVDLATNEIFEVQIEPIPANRHLMKEIESKLLGLSNNQNFTYEGFDYKIQEIRKKDVHSEIGY